MRSNKREFDGRVFVLAPETHLHTSFSRTGRLRAAATAFIQRHMGANDVAAVVYSSSATDTAHRNSPAAARCCSVRSTSSWGRSCPSGAVGLAEQDALLARSGQPATGRDPYEMERAYKDCQLFARLRSVAELIRAASTAVASPSSPSARASSGITHGKTNSNVRTDSTQRTFAADILNELQTTVGAAGRANVSIYAVDPRGLVALDCFEAALGARSASTR